MAVAISWSAYFQELLRGFGVQIPAWLATDFRTAAQATSQLAEAGGNMSALAPSMQLATQAMDMAPRLFGIPFVFNLPAFLIVMLVTVVLVRGISESAWFNSAMVVLKLAIIGFFLVMGAFYVKPENWTPFAPNGWQGISSAAAIIFFAYIGFDAVSTAAEETKNPQRDMPFGIIASLVVCTVIYILVALVLTGLLPYQQLNTAEPLATAFSALGMNWTAGIISLGAVIATTSVLIVFQLGQPRIFFTMARDGLLPAWAAKIHPKYKHAVHHDHPDGPGGRPVCGAREHRRDRRAHEHRHAVRLRARGARHPDPAQDASGSAAPVPDPVGAGGAGARDPVVRLPDGAAADGDVDPLRRLARGGDGLLLPVRLPSQPPARG